MASVAVKFETRHLREQTARWWPGGPVGLEIPVDSSGSVTLVPGLSLHVGLDGPWGWGLSWPVLDICLAESLTSTHLLPISHSQLRQ